MSILLNLPALSRSVLGQLVGFEIEGYILEFAANQRDVLFTSDRTTVALDFDSNRVVRPLFPL